MAKSKKGKRFLSLIVPAYKQEKTIEHDLKTIRSILEIFDQPYEVIVVVDGKIDKTFVNAQKVRSAKISVLGYPNNKGKGYAVRYGMAHAKGDIIAFLDAGMDLNPARLQDLLKIMEEKKADIVVGSKVHPLSNITYPWQRRLLSWGYRAFVKTFFGLSVGDTQVGMKIFRRKVLEDVLPRLLVKRYAFDIEMLAVANYLGYKKIYEGPVTLKFTNWSSITSSNFLQAIFHMMWDTAAVFYRLRLLQYYNNGNKRKWHYDPELDFNVNVG
ncbi:MAG: glycosyltransferase [Patescibacteria group bacterium]|nr:glycosyltransferase [Patescibacteria group bacterium]MDE2588382.1 glycosyltransferase [Patescibacteria group bacterium]